jgi:hypothetical protein
MRLRCRLRQLVLVCEHGDGEQCAALQLPAGDEDLMRKGPR